MTSESLKKILAKNLQYFLEVNNMQQNELAERIGATPQAVCSWVGGAFMPRMDKIQKMADIFGVEKSDLLEDKKGGYYFNKETAKIAQEVYSNPELRMVFDACRNSTPEELKQIAKLAKAIKSAN